MNFWLYPVGLGIDKTGQGGDVAQVQKAGIFGSLAPVSHLCNKR